MNRLVWLFLLAALAFVNAWFQNPATDEEVYLFLKWAATMGPLFAECADVPYKNKEPDFFSVQFGAGLCFGRWPSIAYVYHGTTDGSKWTGDEVLAAQFYGTSVYYPTVHVHTESYFDDGTPRGKWVPNGVQLTAPVVRRYTMAGARWANNILYMPEYTLQNFFSFARDHLDIDISGQTKTYAGKSPNVLWSKIVTDWLGPKGLRALVQRRGITPTEFEIVCRAAAARYFSYTTEPLSDFSFNPSKLPQDLRPYVATNKGSSVRVLLYDELIAVGKPIFSGEVQVETTARKTFGTMDSWAKKCVQKSTPPYALNYLTWWPFPQNGDPRIRPSEFVKHILDTDIAGTVKALIVWNSGLHKSMTQLCKGNGVDNELQTLYKFVVLSNAASLNEQQTGQLRAAAAAIIQNCKALHNYAIY